jgi:hypothetical protein
VDAEDWATGFSLLKRAGLQVSLAGRGLRVPGAGLAEVRRVLPAAYRVHSEPATLEERFFDLLQAPSPNQVPA